MILVLLPAFALDVATVLRTDPAKIAAAREGIEYLYARDLPAARRSFDTITVRWPTSGLGPLGLAILYQERMFENEDFQYEAPYEAARDAARTQLARGFAVPGDEALENFVLASVLGIDAIHLLRRHRAVGALAAAYEGVHALERCKEAAPAFVDPILGDGMFLFWRTVVAERSALIPAFPDRQEEGIRLMQRAEREATFLGPAAGLALAVAWRDESRPELALAQTVRLAERYPHNVLNAVTRFELLLSLQRYEEALALLSALDADEVPRVWFHRGTALGRLERWSEAAGAYRHWLDHAPPDESQRASGWYRYGDALRRSGDVANARTALAEAAARGHKGARRALDRWEE